MCFEVPVDAVGITPTAHDVFGDSGFQVDQRYVMLLRPFGDRLDGARSAAVRLAVRLGDVHRRQRRDDGNARPVEIDCTTGQLEILDGDVRRQRGPCDRREPGLHPAVAVAHPAAQPRRAHIADQLTQRGRQRRGQRVHSAGREDDRSGPRQRRPGARILRRGPPHVAAGPADPADQLDIPTEMRGNDIGPDPRVVGRQPAGRPVIRQRVAEDEECAPAQRTSLATCAEAFHTSRRHRISSKSASSSSE